MTGVLDASPVINLAKGETFLYLRRHFPLLYVPPAVEREVILQGQGLFGEPELREALDDWILKMSPGSTALSRFAGLSALTRGDREVLALAWEKKVDVILTDDLQIISQATLLAMRVLDIPDLLFLLKQHGDILAVKPVLDLMSSRHYGISPRLYQEILQTAGEGH